MGKTLEDKAEPLTSNSELFHCGGAFWLYLSPQTDV